MATIVGKAARYVPAPRAQEHVFGYTVMLDISDRGGRPPGGFAGVDWFVMKGQDTFGPMGPALVCLPAALWLYHQGATGWAIFIMVWGVGVGSVDNFLKPWLISRGSTTPFLLILFGVLGGAIGFGFIGIFLGPTLLAVGYRVVEQWFAQQSAAVASPAAVVTEEFSRPMRSPA